MENKINKYFKILYFLLSITVVFDSVNGFLTMYISNSVASIIPLSRFFLVLFFLFFIILIDKDLGKRITLVSILFLFTTNIVSILYKNPFNGIIQNNIYSIKLLSFFILSALLVTLTRKKYLNKDSILNILKINGYLIVLLIIIPTILGVSRQTYLGSNLGSSGFFISNNSTNYVLIITTYSLLYIWNKKNEIKIKDKYTHLFFLLSIYCLWLQGSKTSFLFLILILGHYLLILSTQIYCWGFKLNKSMKKRKKHLVLISIFIFFTVALLYIYLNFESILEYIYYENKEFISRQQYQMEIQGNWLSYLTSGRTEYVTTVIQNVKEFYDLRSLIFGIGIYSLRALGKITEMDFIDIILATGIIGICITYGVFVKNVITVFLRKNHLKLYLILIFGFTFIFSFFAGHVFVDFISSTILSVVIALNYIPFEELTNENINDI